MIRPDDERLPWGGSPRGWSTALMCIIALNACSRGQGGSSRATNDDDCEWSFSRYEPSHWETEWIEGITTGERRDHECEVLATPVEVERSVKLVRATSDAMLRGKVVPPESLDLFSRMVYVRRCGPEKKETGQRRAQLIEPLIGILRDPLTICPRPKDVPDEVFTGFGPGESYGQSKRHFLARVAAPWSDTPENAQSWRIGEFGLPSQAVPESGARPYQSILIDMGASTFDAWNGDPSAIGAAWFVERHQRRGHSFDWIVSYEYQKHDPDTIYKAVPPDILPHYIYYNQPVEKDPQGKWNPWRILRGMGATRNDFVVVKLDIDSPEIENPLVRQVMVDAGLQAIIDEIFYEHHVNSKPMWPYWETQKSTITMADSYREFAFLRSKGVRMHSWP